MPTNLPPHPNPPRALLLGSRWPEPRSTAAGLRTQNALEILRDNGWETHFATAAQLTQRSELPPGILSHEIRINDSDIEPWLRKLAPEIVVLDRFYTEEQLGWRIRSTLPNALRVLDTSDLHFVREARELALKNNTPVDLAQAALSETGLRELGSILRCDLTWVVSPFERDLLTQSLSIPAELIDCSGIAYPAPPERRPLAERKGLICIGTFQHAPNQDAVRWLKRELWPRIRALKPDATLRVCGSYLTREFADMHAPQDGFSVQGTVEDARQEMSLARLSIAPLRFGAGIKGKILDSWWAGTPVVTTPIGAEGMQGSGPFEGLIGESPDELARHVARLLTDDELWDSTSLAGLHAIRSRYGYANECARMGLLLRKRLEELPTSRRRHWMGALLHSQSLRSTEYFARWIEAKSSTQRNPNMGMPTEMPTLLEK